MNNPVTAVVISLLVVAVVTLSVVVFNQCKIINGILRSVPGMEIDKKNAPKPKYISPYRKEDNE